MSFEQLEDRRMLATIFWANELDSNGNFNQFNQFEATYGENAPLARAIVNRAIDDWEAVIERFNYADDGDPNTTHDSKDEFTLTVTAGSPPGGFGAAGSFAEEAASGKPISAAIEMGTNAGGHGWFFDETPRDDVEFTGLISENSATFVDEEADAKDRVFDFYYVLIHEMGHALGFSAVYSRWNAALIGGVLHDGSGNPIAQMIDNGGHLYGGSPSDPPGQLSHPNLVMTKPNEDPVTGFTAPFGDPEETTRRWISDFEAQILEELYGYTVNLPSSFNSAHVMHDSITGQLLVQGAARDSAGVGIADTIDIEIDGGNVKVTVANANGMFVEKTPTADVTEIIVHGNGGSDTLNGQALGAVSSVAGIDVTVVDYVVSSNQDELEGPTSVGNDAGVPDTDDGIVDISPEVPGSQTTLRAAAVQDADFSGYCLAA